MINDQTFRAVSRVNLERAQEWHPDGLEDWSPLEWAGAMCGEAGEAANAAKKLKRAETGLQQANGMTVEDCRAALAQEIGDTYLYLDLLAQRAAIDMFKAIRDTFNRVSEREGFEQRLGEGGQAHHVLEEVAAERARQIHQEGWSPKHDDEHTGDELAIAAACYALGECSGIPQGYWPWDPSWWKPKDRRRDLIRAAALLVAEIERLDRADAL